MRAGGARVGVGELLAAHRALAAVDASDRIEAFLALRATLCSSRAELAVFTEAFNTVFAGELLENPLEALGEIEKAAPPRAGVPQSSSALAEPDPDGAPATPTTCARRCGSRCATAAS